MPHRSNYRALRKRTIRTGGKRMPGLPFMGELMTCCLCAKEQQSDPAVESGWDHIEVDGQGFYVCPDHLAEARAGKESYKDAWERILLAVIEKSRNGENS